MRARPGALLCVFLSLAGIGLCVYLAFVHLALMRGEFAGGAACGAAGSIFNCHAVTAGPFGKVFGMPLWVWGLIGYLATLNLALIAWAFQDWTAKALTVLTVLSSIFIVVDLFLFIAMVTRIHFLCLFCLLTYAVNLALVVIGKLACAQPWGRLFGQFGAALGAFLPSTQRPVSWLFFGAMALGVGSSVGLQAATNFLMQGDIGMVRKQLHEFVAQQQRVRPDISGDPALGPANAQIEIIEFSDFLCPVCQRASRFNTIILANYRQRVRFVFKHFPLDTSCNGVIQRTLHPGACRIAAATECAHLQGKFWPFHDVIFEEPDKYPVDRLEPDAMRFGLDLPRFQACLTSGEGMEAVKRDVAEGQKLGATSTPTYVINGLKLSGVMNPAMFEEFVKVLEESR